MSKKGARAADEALKVLMTIGRGANLADQVAAESSQEGVNFRGSRNPKTREAADLGRRVHEEWKNLGKYGEGYEAKRTTLPSGRRPEAINWEKQDVVELKPNNPRAIERGERQVEGYRQELEKVTKKPWTSKVVTYDK